VPAGPAMPPLSSREGGAAQSRRADPTHRSMPRSVWPSVPPDGQAGRPCRGRTPSCSPRSFHASKCCGRASQPRREPRRRYCESPAAGRMWNSGPVESTPGGTRAGPFASKLAKARHVRRAFEMSRRTHCSRAWRRARGIVGQGKVVVTLFCTEDVPITSLPSSSYFDVALEYADLSLPLRFLRVGDPRSSPARLESDLEPRDKAALQCP